MGAPFFPAFAIIRLFTAFCALFEQYPSLAPRHLILRLILLRFLSFSVACQKWCLELIGNQIVVAMHVAETCHPSVILL